MNLSLTGVYLPPFDVGVYYLEDDDWSCNINWSNAPSPHSTPTDVQNVYVGNWYQWEVTDDVVDAWNDDKGYSVVLRHVNEGTDPAENSDWDSMEDYYELYPYLSVGFQYGLDYGDAPDPTYPTLSASNGACHSLEAGPHLGTAIDYEADPDFTVPPSDPPDPTVDQITEISGLTNGNMEGGAFNDPDGDHRTANAWHQFTIAGFSKSNTTW